MTEERAPYSINQQPMEKLPPETFAYYLDHVAYMFPTMRHQIKRLGGKSLGIRLIIDIPFEGMTEGGQRYIFGASTVEEQIRVLNWALGIDDQETPAKFKLREWKVKAGPSKAQIVMLLDREQ